MTVFLARMIAIVVCMFVLALAAIAFVRWDLIPFQPWEWAYQIRFLFVALIFPVSGLARLIYEMIWG